MLNERFSYMYLMTPVADREKDFDSYLKAMESTNVSLLRYKVTGYEMDPSDKDKATVYLNYKIEIKNGDVSQIVEKDNAQWQSVRENNIWKIKAVFDAQ